LSIKLVVVQKIATALKQQGTIPQLKEWFNVSKPSKSFKS
jgi:hypothetical protein